MSDAAKHVVGVDAIPNSLHPKLFRATYVAHLLHNRAIKVKSHFELLIS